MTVILAPETLKALATQIKADINAYTADLYEEGHRKHLGASIIGNECTRYIWYSYRWVKTDNYINDKGENHKGRMQRLFQRGHLEEMRWIKWLRGMGWQVWDVDTNGKQFRIRGIKGHFGGSQDGVGMFPIHLAAIYNLPMLLEFKTYNDKQFKDLVLKGLQLKKPQHYSQMCVYGKGYDFKYGIYFAVNKNDDDIYIEIVELSVLEAERMERRATIVIESITPPAKLAKSIAHFVCKFCVYKEICHLDKPVEINCRSCRNAQAIDNGEWACLLYNCLLTDELIKTGCQSHIGVD